MTRRVLVVCVLFAATTAQVGAQATFSFLVAAGSEATGSRDGAGAEAQFNAPAGLVRDSAGNLFVADSNNHTIRKVTPAGVVTTFAGAAGAAGSTDGAGSAARFTAPYALAIDNSDHLYVAENDFVSTTTDLVRTITPAGVVSTLGGGLAAQFQSPGGIAVDDRDGSVYVTNIDLHTIDRIALGGAVTTIAGTAGLTGSTDGVGPAARFNQPHGIAVDAAGVIYVADSQNYTVRRVATDRTVTTWLGAAGDWGPITGGGGGQYRGIGDGPAATARFYLPERLSLDRSSGRLLIVSSSWFSMSLPGSRITIRRDVLRAVAADGTVTTLKWGGPEINSGVWVGATAMISTAGAGYANSQWPGIIFSVSTTYGVLTPFAGRGGGCTPWSYPLDGTRLSARFCDVRSIAVDRAGVMYVADGGNNNIRRVATDGAVITLAGTAGVYGSADGAGSAASFGNLRSFPDSAMGIAVDATGNLFVADTANSTLRRIAPDGTTTTLAGLARSPGTTDGTGTAARFNLPHDVAVDSAGNVFVADTGNSSIRKITPSGVVTTVAGLSGVGGSADGVGSAAMFNAPYSIAIGPGDAMYIADTGNHTIRKMMPDATVTTLAGVAGSAGTVDGRGAVVRFNAPKSIAVDALGNVFAGEPSSSRIRKITPAGEVTTITTPLSCGPGCTGGYSAVTDVDAAGSIYAPHGALIVVGTTAGETAAAPAITTQPASQTITAGQPVTFTVAASGVPSATYRWQSSADGGTTWTDVTDGAPYSGAMSSTLSVSTTVVSYPLLRRFRAIATNAFGTATSDAAVLTVPGLLVQPASLWFRVLKSGAAGPVLEHPVQDMLATFVAMAPGTITWAADQPWVKLVAAATGPAVSVWIDDPDNVLAGSTSASAVITASTAGGGPSVQIPLSLEIVQDYRLTMAPIGQVDTPVQGASGVQGAIAFSGWATDDIGVFGVLIYRNCIPDEPQENCQVGVIPGRGNDRVVRLGTAQLVPGARPDIEAAFPNYPGNRAGWGFLILTNMLPRTTGTFSPSGGQGDVTLYAVAMDGEGNYTLLGRNWSNDATPTAITMDNDAIAKPFGAIDTPAQGERITSASFNNFGWVLTPDTDSVQGNSDIDMANASGLTLFIDGLPVTAIAYNQCRGTVGNPVPPGVFCDDDISNIFGAASVQASLTTRTSNPTPYRNLDAGRGAIGAAVIDVTGLSNGLHTMAWSATDSSGRVEGIGSRYFSVLRPQTAPATDALPEKTSGVFFEESAAKKTPDVFSAVAADDVVGRSGFDLSTSWTSLTPGPDVGRASPRNSRAARRAACVRSVSVPESAGPAGGSRRPQW